MKKILLIVCIVLNNTCKAQVPQLIDCNIINKPPKNLPIPDMYVDKSLSQMRESKFAGKHIIIEVKKRIQVHDFMCFPRAPFVSMLSHFCNDLKFDELKICFAQYPKIPGQNIPAGWENKLIIIFNPLKNSQSLGYFTIPDQGASYSDITSVAQNWIDNYDTIIRPVLENTLIDGDSDNEDPAKTGTYSDTRFVKYCAFDWMQLLQEMYYQDNIVFQKPGYVSGIQVVFSSYGADGDDELSPRFHFRLIPIFELTTKKNHKDVVFDIGDQKDFLKIRKPKLNSCQINAKKQFIEHIYGIGVDNGQLCPTICN